MVSASRIDNLGYIVRTAAEGIQQEKLSYEMGFLRNIWAGIKKKYETASCPSMIHQELSVSLRAVRDLLIQDAERLVIDSREGYESIISFLDTLMPSLKASVECYDGTESIFLSKKQKGVNSTARKKKILVK